MPPLVISIQSQVVFGHVGNSAAVFPMLAAGMEVAPIPTVLFSNTPTYPTRRGTALPPEMFADLLLGAEERGLPERAAYIVTGYFGSLEVAKLTAGFVRRAKAVNPALRYLCDPVIGDEAPGRYVPEPIAEVIRDDLLPLADIVTPNPFELGWLSGQPLTRPEDLQRMPGRLRLNPGAVLIATGCRLPDTAPGHIETVVVAPEAISRHPVRKLPVALGGTGDLFAGLIVAAMGRNTPLPAAVDAAQAQMTRAILEAQRLGRTEVALSDPAFRAALLDAP
ncbi:pyridoxal kinase [Paenirhodobacter sp.]|uniref:pyridoxal kinase n=1 Tax=Paenirhodobacter sp. TaxID=1965326 RepID=UPI003B41CE87